VRPREIITILTATAVLVLSGFLIGANYSHRQPVNVYVVTPHGKTITHFTTTLRR